MAPAECGKSHSTWAEDLQHEFMAYNLGSIACNPMASRLVLTSRMVLRGRLQYSHSNSWPVAELSSSSFSRSSSCGDRQARSSKKERRGTLAMSRYRVTRCHTEQGWGSPGGEDTPATGVEVSWLGPQWGHGWVDGSTQLTWLARLQCKPLIRVQAQHLTELLDIGS